MSDQKGGRVIHAPLVEPSVAAMWGAYRATVLEPSGIKGGVQLVETRRTFYAACTAIMGLLAQMAVRDLHEDEGSQILEGLHRECGEFMRKLGRGEEGY